MYAWFVLLTQDTLNAELESTRTKIVELSRQLEEKSRDLDEAKSDLEVTRKSSEV